MRRSSLTLMVLAVSLWVSGVAGAQPAPWNSIDGYGYYATNSEPFQWIPADVAHGGTLVALDQGSGSPEDGSSAPVRIGFPFTFYGLPVSKVRISANGFIDFAIRPDSMGPFFLNGPIPDRHRDPDTFIAPFWDDLDPTAAASGDVSSMTEGPVGSRKFVVQWTRMSILSDPNVTVTFQLILYEGSNCIRFQYREIPNIPLATGRSATIGIESLSGANGIQYGFNEAGRIADNLAIDFCPPGPSLHLTPTMTPSPTPQHTPTPTPQPPIIRAAGFGDTFLTECRPQNLAIYAWTESFTGQPVQEVEVYLGGKPTGIFLNDDRSNQVSAPGDGIFELRISGAALPPGRYLVQLMATDVRGATSTLWPSMPIRPAAPPPFTEPKASRQGAVLEAIERFIAEAPEAHGIVPSASGDRGLGTGDGPRILAAGYDQTMYREHSSGAMSMVAITVPGTSGAAVTGVEASGGAFALRDVGGDLWTYGPVPLGALSLPDAVLLTLEATDSAGNVSDEWPYLTVHPCPTATPTPPGTTSQVNAEKLR